jgi:hypothetical protein
MGNFMPTNGANVFRLDGHDTRSLTVQSHEFNFISPSTLIDMHNRPDIARH